MDKHPSNLSSSIRQATPKLVLPEQAIKKPASILNLPPEVILMIFKHLHANESLCLGLRSKKLYDIHFKIFGRSPLSGALSSVRPGDYLQRFDMICEFVGPKWVFCHASYKWVRIEEASSPKTPKNPKLRDVC